MFQGHKHVAPTNTPQSQPLPNSNQIKMRSGGFGFEVDNWTKLERFLILGSEGGTYYATEKTLTQMSCEVAKKLIAKDGISVVKLVRDVSVRNRAPKNDPALFILAMAAKMGSPEVRHAAFTALPDVARIGTHLFHFCAYAKVFGGIGGNGFKRALSRWYLNRTVPSLVLQLVKYQSRDGWSHRDVLRLARPKADGHHQSALRYAVKGRENELTEDFAQVPDDLHLIWAWEKAKILEAGEWKEMVKLINNFRLPHECVPNHFKDRPEIWEALVHSGMPPGALLRNLNKLTAVGLISGSSSVTNYVKNTFGSMEALKKARLHPMSILVASKVYSSGKGLKGSLTWKPHRAVLDALDDAFYLAFGAVEPTGKRLCLALDVSGSMGSGVAGVSGLTCREAAAAMALVTANVEKDYEIIGYTCSGSRIHASADGSLMRPYRACKNGVSTLSISPKQRLDDVVRSITGLDFGGTDCALPFLWATHNNEVFDGFISYTDNESWAGPVHVKTAIKKYRNRFNASAKGVFVAFACNEYGVADTGDAGQMNVVGFDTDVPNIISDFISG